MHLLFQPNPPTAYKSKNNFDGDSYAFSILHLSGFESKTGEKEMDHHSVPLMDHHSAPLEGVGLTPNDNLVLINTESSNNDYLNNNTQNDHPGLANIQNGATLPISLEFCSYVRKKSYISLNF